MHRGRSVIALPHSGLAASAVGHVARQHAGPPQTPASISHSAPECCSDMHGSSPLTDLLPSYSRPFPSPPSPCQTNLIATLPCVETGSWFFYWRESVFLFFLPPLSIIENYPLSDLRGIVLHLRLFLSLWRAPCPRGGGGGPGPGPGGRAGGPRGGEY